MQPGTLQRSRTSRNCLVEGTGHEPGNALAAFSGILQQLRGGGQTSLECLEYRHLDLFGSGADLGRVKNAPGGAGEAHPLPDSHILSPARPTRRMDGDARQRRQVTPGSRNGDMDGGRDDVAQAKQVEGAFVGNDRLVLADG